MSDLLWGIDLGGTKLEGVVLTPDSVEKPICRVRIDTEAEQGYDHILSRIKQLVHSLQDQAGTKPSTIGFGTPGVIDPKTKLLKNSNTVCLNHKPLHRDLENILELPVVLSNDANCFALAESRWGAGRGAHGVFGVIMGTGVGGGIVVDGRILQGHQGIAGEWGHNVVDPTGEKCYCGKHGCVETIVSGPALERFYRIQSGESHSFAEIVRLAREGENQSAVATFHRLLEYFGKALAVVINILDPEIVVLGGGLSNIDELYTEGPRYLSSYVFNDQLHTNIKKNELGDSAGVFGAAHLTATQR